MLAWHLASRYLRRRRMAWLAMAAVTLTVSVSVIVLGVMEGWVRLTELQVRAAEADLRLTGFPAIPEGNPVAAGLRAHPEVEAAAPVIASWVGLLPERERRGSADQRMLPVQMEGIDWAADRAIGRMLDDWLHQPGSLDLNADDLTLAERGSGFVSRDCVSAMTLAPLEGLGGALPIGTTPVPRPHLPYQAGAVVGREFLFDNAHDGIRIGDRVSLVLPNGRGGLTGKAVVELTDTIGTGIIEVDRYLVVVPLPVAQRITDQDPHSERPGRPSVDGYRMQLRTDAAPAQVRDQLYEHSPTRQALVPGTQSFYIETWQERRPNAVRMVENFRRIIGLVMIILQGLCIFTVAAVFSTLVAEKRHDIGVLIGVGARPLSILVTFLAAAVVACVGGSLLGWGIGWGVLAVLNPVSEFIGKPLFPQSVFYAKEAPISFELGTPLLFIAIQAGVGLLSALWPAWRASRIDPVATIREAG